MIAGRWCLLLFTLVFSLRAQDPFAFEPVWVATFDAEGADVPEAIIVDAQGNLLIAGRTSSAETLEDGLLVKVNAIGQRVWARRFDSTISQDDQFTDVAADSAGNAAVVGLAADRDAPNALLVASYAAANGSTRWLKSFPGSHLTSPVVGVDAAGDVYARTAVEDGSGQIIRTYKFSPAGTALWTNEISAPRDLTFGFDTRPNLLVHPDGSTYLATLKTSAAGDLDWNVVKLRPDGSQQWQVEIGGTNYESQPLIAFHASGNVVVAGGSQNNNGTLDILIELRSSETGERVWQSKLRASSSFKAGSHFLNDLSSDNDGNIWLAGRTPTWGGFVSRFDLIGTFEWITHFSTNTKKIVPLGGGQAFVSIDSGVAWVDDNGAVLKVDTNYRSPLITTDANNEVYAAFSFYKAEGGGDYGLAAEKLFIDRSALAPTVTDIPEFTTGVPLLNVELAPQVTGSNLNFAWTHNGTLIPGRTNRTLVIDSVDATTIGFYNLVAANSYGASISPDIEVLTATPIFVSQPRSQTFAYGGDVAFSALAIGYEPQLDFSSIFSINLAYQWFYNGIAIPWATQSKLLIRKADESWIGRYKVRAAIVSPGGVISFADSDEVTLDWPLEGINEAWRDQFYIPGQPLTQPSGMEFKANGDLALSLESPYKEYRADIANDNVLSYAVENFRPAVNPLPKGPHFSDSQGNFYTIGETNLVDTSVDWMVSKHSANGALLWQQSISSLGRQIDRVSDAVVTPNDDIVVTGWSNSTETGTDAFTVCLNKADGTTRWSAVFDDPAGVRIPFAGEAPSAIGVDKNGNTFIAGTGAWLTGAFHFLVSYDSNGSQRFVYERPWSTIADTPPRLAIDPNGNAVVGGTFGLMKIDGTGRELWSTDLRALPTVPAPVVYGVQVDRSGNIYLSGNISGSGAFGKFDAFGGLQVQTFFTDAFPDANFDPSARFSVDDYGDIYLSGTGGNIFSEKDIVGVKLNPYLYRYWMVRVDGGGLDLALDMKAQGNDVYLTGSSLIDNTLEASVAKFTQTPLAYSVKDVTGSKTIKRGTTLHLEAQATGNPPFFQWYKDNQPILGAWAAVVDLPNATSANEGFYALQVYDSFGGSAFDAGFAIRVADPPAITTQPVSTNVVVNGQIALSAVASGSAPLFYQWQVNGVAITNATNATLTIDHAQFSDRGDYKLVVSNAWGTATSFAATVKVLAPANLPPIVKITEPADRLVQRDNTVVHLRAAAYDADGRVTQVVFRANGATAAVIGVAPFDATWTPPGVGIYKVTATASDNLGASTTSAEVEVVVAPAPIFTKQPPTFLPIAENSDITLEAEATSAPPPRYQWRLNGANIPGATNRTYTISGAQARNSGRYAALAINEGAATISSKAEVIVDAPSLTLTDQFADAVEVSDIQFTGRGNNRNATKEVGEPNHARRKGGKSVWLRYRAPASGVMSINTRGSAFDTLLAVYSGSSVTSLTQLAADDERGGFHCSALRFNAVKGEVYNIAVDGFNGQSGNIVLSWALDTSSRPLPVITTEPDSIGTGLNSVAAFHVDALGNGLTFQWFFNGYPVPGATSSGLVLSGVARKNVGDYVVRVTNGDGSVESQEAELELGNGNEPVTQDRVEDLLPNTAGAPKGAVAASFAGYPTISPGVPYRKFFNTAGATADDNEPVLGDGGGASKWFLINAGGNGTLVADTIGSDFPNVITLHDPSNFDTLPVLANGVPLPGGTSRVTYPATNGLAYLIRVDGVDQAEGNVVLNVTIGSEPAVTSGSLDQVIAAGQSATLNATVTASPAATFQWYLNDKLLPGATAATLQLTNFDPAQVGAYALEAKNALGSVKKTIAYLEIGRPVVFSASPTAQANGSITMQLEGNNRTYWIDITQDFINWTNVFSARTDNGALIYTDTPAANQPLGFYRARWQ